MQKTYGELYLKKNKFVIDKLSPHVAIKLKNIFSKIPKNQVYPFVFDKTMENAADLLWFNSRYPMEITASDLKILKSLDKEHVAKLDELYNIEKDNNITLFSDVKLKEGMELRNYQKQAIKVLMNKKVLLCADDLGLGKTYTGIGSLLSKEMLPAVIVVQTHLPKQWDNKIKEFCELKTHLIDKTKPYPLPDADVYIFKYSNISGWVDIFNEKKFKTVVFDEIQELRAGTTTMKGGSARVLCKNAEYKLGLSATPIYNYGDEIWNIYDILEKDILGDRNDFLREWSGGYSTSDKKVIIQDPKAFGAYLRDNYLMIRRTKHDVNQFLKPVNKVVHQVGYDEKAVISCIELSKILAIKTIEGEFTERGQAARELDILMRQYTGVSKAKYVAEFVKIFLSNNEPVILVGWHREVYDLWLKELSEFNPVLYTGSESTKEKLNSYNKFVNGESNLLILSLRSGAGIDGFQKRCSNIIFGELDWSPQVHEQAIGRLYREGQTESVMAFYLVSEFGSDPLMIDLLGIKASQSDSIINQTNNILATNLAGDESRLKMLANKVLEKK